RFEGIEEPLARLAVATYVLDAARVQTCGAVDRGERPAVLSAILKYQATERMRTALNDALDIQGGKAICEGPGNGLANVYHAIPVAITVEGANILTRSLIIFGQGAVRAHPWLVVEMQAAQDRDLAGFDKALRGHLGWFLGNLGRVIRHSYLGAKYIKPPIDGPTARYFRELARDSARLALLADAAMALLGGELKRRESLSGRFADILSELYLISCVLRRFEDDGRPGEDLPLVDAAARWGFYTVQERIDAILANFPNPWAGRLLRLLVLPRRNRRPPPDALNHAAAALLMTPGTARDRLTRGIFIGRAPDDPAARLDYALDRVLAAEAIESRLKGSGHEDDPGAAHRAGLIDAGQFQILEEARQAMGRAIQVDDFEPAELLRSPQAPRRERADRLRTG
ncbi:MAG: acyl-CoA dehydrogenase domain-containing protein, partial [Candidatus Competibacteraceae bacterium]|nr:acyl-CoA dehydrogenase domain-containing protein [Candidatus Competibacteraceae bacterium]